MRVGQDYRFEGPDGELLTTFNYLDLTPSGRPYHVGEVPHHDRYGGDRSETNVAFLLQHPPAS